MKRRSFLMFAATAPLSMGVIGGSLFESGDNYLALNDYSLCLIDNRCSHLFDSKVFKVGTEIVIFDGDVSRFWQKEVLPSVRRNLIKSVYVLAKGDATFCISQLSESLGYNSYGCVNKTEGKYVNIKDIDKLNNIYEWEFKIRT